MYLLQIGAALFYYKLEQTFLQTILQIRVIITNLGITASLSTYQVAHIFAC